MTLTFVSVVSKVRRSHLSHSLFKWWKMTSNEKISNIQAQAKLALEQDKSIVEESARELNSRKVEINKLFEEKKIVLEAREEELTKREGALNDEELNLEKKLAAIRTQRGEVSEEWNRLKELKTALEGRSLDLDKREKELVELKDEVENELLSLEETGMKKEKETESLRLSLAEKSKLIQADRMELNKNVRVYDEKLIVLEDRMKALSEKEEHLRKKEEEVSN